MTREWQSNCVLCNFGLDEGHCCNRCRNLLKQQLVQIERLVHDAACQLVPAHKPGGGSHSFGSKPPIDTAAVDAELALIELNKGDATSAVPILECLEMWERAVREDRLLAPYGHATASAPAGTSNDTKATLAHVVGFLSAHTDWMCEDPEFGLDEYADHLKRAVIALKRWDPENDSRGMRIPCPTQLDDGPCNYPLVIRGMDDMTCRRCDNEWNVLRLIANADPHTVWASPATLADVLNVSANLLHQWATRGHIHRDERGRYNLGNVRDHLATRPKRTAG